MNKKILIIEDEATLMDVLSEKFSDKSCGDFTIIKATNGSEGYDMALTNHPDLILLDIVMPIMDGMTMLEKLRKDPWGKNVKIFILTNLSDTEKISKSKSQGVTQYLIKSDWKLDDIVKKVNQELSTS